MRFALYRPVWDEMAPTTFDFYPILCLRHKVTGNPIKNKIFN